MALPWYRAAFSYRCAIPSCNGLRGVEWFFQAASDEEAAQQVKQFTPGTHCPQCGTRLPLGVPGTFQLEVNQATEDELEPIGLID